MNATKTMAKKRGTKSALLTSLLSLLLCVTMLIGTTFAWFTDSVTSGENKIIAGNLDIDVEYKAFDTNTSTISSDWKPLQDATDLFSADLWEPGHTEVVYLKIVNKGTLAFNYTMNVTPISETTGINAAGNSFKLSDFMSFGATEAQTTEVSFADRAAARAEATDIVYNADRKVGLTQDNQKNLSVVGSLDSKDATNYLALVVYMPEEVGNDANYKTGTTPPQIKLGVTVYATQKQYEKDSFNDEYDKDADLTPDNKDAGALKYSKYVQVSQTIQKDGDAITGQTLTKYAEGSNTVKQAEVKIPATRVDVNATDMSLLLEETTAPANLTVDSTQGSKNYELTVTGLVAGEDVITGTMFIGKGLENVKLYHNVTEEFSSEGITSVDQVTSHGTFYYNSDTGNITFATTSFSPFSALFDMPAGVSGEGTMEETYYKTANAAQAAANKGTVVVAYRDVAKDEEDNEDSIEKEEGEEFYIPQARIETTYYSKLTDAFTAATAGSTITLIKDCAESGLNAKVANVTLDMNGHKLTNTSGNTINQWSSGSLNIKGDENSVISGTVRVYTTLTFTADFAGKVTGTILRGGGKLNINGGVFDGTFSKSETTVAISGGSFKTKPTTSNSLKCAEDKTFEYNTNTGYYDVVPVTADNAITSVTVGTETKYYMTLKEAQNAAIAGGTIKLLKDFDYGSNSIEANYYPTGNVKLDLNGKTLNLGGYTNFIMLYSGTLTLTDSVGGGTIASNNSSTLFKVYNAANMVVNDITCNSDKVTLIDYDTSATGSTTLTNVTLAKAISARGNVTYNKCTITEQVTVWGGSTLTVNGGNYKMLAIYSGATLNVNSGNIGYINNSGTVNIETCVIDTALCTFAYGSTPSAPTFTGCKVVANETTSVSWTVTKLASGSATITKGASTKAKVFTVGGKQFFLTYSNEIVADEVNEAVITLTEATAADQDVLKYKVNGTCEYYKLTATGVKKADDNKDPNFSLIRVGSTDSEFNNGSLFERAAVVPGCTKTIGEVQYNGHGQSIYLK